MTRFLIISSAVSLSAFIGGCTEQRIHGADTRNSGVSLYEQGEYPDAAARFREAADLNPRDYKAHFNLGVTYEKMGRPMEAILSYRTAMKVIDSTNAGQNDDAYRDRIIDAYAAAIARHDQYGTEMATLRRTATTAEDFLVLAKANAYSQDPDSAIEAYEKALIVDKTYFPAVKSYGLYLLAIQQHDRAEKMLVRAFDLKRNDAEVNAGLAQMNIVAGPSLLPADRLAEPDLPRGPIPPVKRLFEEPEVAQPPQGQTTASTDSGM